MSGQTTPTPDPGARPRLAVLAGVAGAIDRLNARIGTAAAWLVLFLVVVQFALVILRYVFGLGSIMAQESLLWAHALLFLLAAGWTLMLDGHVRVDVLYREMAPRGRAVVDLLGVILLLLPFCLLLWRYGLPYVATSWAALEGSRETSGLPGLFLLKSAILLFALLLGLQGLSLGLRALLVLTGGGADRSAGGRR